MRREARLLLDKASDSLTLSVEFFNRPHDIGRATACLIFLDHAFEMLLKAGIVARGGKIREKRANETIGFDKCVRCALTNGEITFLTEEQALLLQSINGLRDAAQHYLLDLSENNLYLQVQAGLTLFRDLVKTIFNLELSDFVSRRVLPVSTSPPVDLTIMFENETSEIVKLLKPGARRKLEAQARLRPLVILDATLRGEKRQPAPSQLDRVGIGLSNGKSWQELFPGVAAVQITGSDDGFPMSLRLSKKDGAPVVLVPEGTPGASVVAIKRVNELGYYCLGLDQVAEIVGLTSPKALAFIKYLGLQNDVEYFKKIAVGKVEYKRYSQKVPNRLREELPKVSMDDVWQSYRPKRQSKT